MNIPLTGLVPTPVVQRPAGPKPAAGTAGFQALLAPSGTPRETAPTDASAQASALFLIQSDEGGLPRRRKRTPTAAAAHALDLLQGLQRGLLAGADGEPHALEDAAAEAEELAASASDPQTRSLCAAVALRLRVERAKLGH